MPATWYYTFLPSSRKKTAFFTPKVRVGLLYQCANCCSQPTLLMCRVVLSCLPSGNMRVVANHKKMTNKQKTNATAYDNNVNVRLPKSLIHHMSQSYLALVRTDLLHP